MVDEALSVMNTVCIVLYNTTYNIRYEIQNLGLQRNMTTYIQYHTTQCFRNPSGEHMEGGKAVYSPWNPCKMIGQKRADNAICAMT